MDLTTATLLAHAAATLSMTGVIWIIQRVHYPLMIHVADGDFTAFERDHQRRIGPIVMPLMLVELATTAALLALPVPRLLSVTGALLLAAIWLCTFFVQVPIHRRLEAGRSPPLIAQLVRTNWLRTILWSARAGVALAMLAL